MIRLNLTVTPEWLDLAPGLRLLVGPLTTALMVSARADPAIEALPEGATQEALALAMAKAVARRAVLDWDPTHQRWHRFQSSIRAWMATAMPIRATAMKTQRRVSR